MPASDLGQLITFAVALQASTTYTSYSWYDATKGETIKAIAASLGHPTFARDIADLNGIKHTYDKLPANRRIRIPGDMRSEDTFSVLAGDEAPRIVDGYAKYETLDRPGRTGLNSFQGYNPLEMEIPVRFEGVRYRRDGSGGEIENDIATLERMAGRGQFPGAGSGSPPVITISVTRNGKMIPLIPQAYQLIENPQGPRWRVTGIDWAEGALRDHAGQRIRQLATINVRQHVDVSLVSRSATERSKAKNSSKERNARRGELVSRGISATGRR